MAKSYWKWKILNRRHAHFHCKTFHHQRMCRNNQTLRRLQATCTYPDQPSTCHYRMNVGRMPLARPIMLSVSRMPIGVVAAITPWNMPLIIAIAKPAPALAAGCTLVEKPADLTPLDDITPRGIDPRGRVPLAGVVNTSFPVMWLVWLVRLWHDHMDVDKIAFTGSTATGKSIVSAAATSNLKKVALELGGKSPVLVFPDADLDQAAQTCAEGIFLEFRQMGFAGSRLIVHESIEDEIVGRIVEGAQSHENWPRSR